jgi:hypothetical protein
VHVHGGCVPYARRREGRARAQAGVPFAALRESPKVPYRPVRADTREGGTLERSRIVTHRDRERERERRVCALRA